MKENSYTQGVYNLSMLDYFRNAYSYLFRCMVENERPVVRALQIVDLRSLFDMRRIDKIPKARVMELYGKRNGEWMDEKIDENSLLC